MRSVMGKGRCGGGGGGWSVEAFNAEAFGIEVGGAEDGVFEGDGEGDFVEGEGHGGGGIGGGDCDFVGEFLGKDIGAEFVAIEVGGIAVVGEFGGDDGEAVGVVIGDLEGEVGGAVEGDDAFEGAGELGGRPGLSVGLESLSDFAQIWFCKKREDEEFDVTEVIGVALHDVILLRVVVFAERFEGEEVKEEVGPEGGIVFLQEGCGGVAEPGGFGIEADEEPEEVRIFADLEDFLSGDAAEEDGIAAVFGEGFGAGALAEAEDGVGAFGTGAVFFLPGHFDGSAGGDEGECGGAGVELGELILQGEWGREWKEGIGLGAGAAGGEEEEEGGDGEESKGHGDLRQMIQESVLDGGMMAASGSASTGGAGRTRRMTRRRWASIRRMLV